MGVHRNACSLLMLVCLFGIASSDQESIYDFLLSNVNKTNCNSNSLFWNKTSNVMRNECNISFTDKDLSKKYLCHSISLVISLICSEPNAVKNKTESLSFDLSTAEACGDAGIQKYTQVGLFQTATNYDMSASLQKIVGNCSGVCSSMQSVCSAFVSYCHLAFDEIENQSQKTKTVTLAVPKKAIDEVAHVESSLDDFPQDETESFLASYKYVVLVATLACILFYVMLLKKNRVIACMLEGRRPRPKKYTRVSMNGGGEHFSNGSHNQPVTHSPQLFKTSFDSDDELDSTAATADLLKNY